MLLFFQNILLLSVESSLINYLFFNSVRQLGFEDVSVCPRLCKLSMEYLKKRQGCEASIYEYFSHHDESDADNLYVKFCQEMENCILTYFAFHWNHASDMITQVINLSKFNTL